MRPDDARPGPWKHALVLVGALTLLGAFLPLIEVHHARVPPVALTARELTFGLERMHKLIERQLPGVVEAHIPAYIREARDDIRTVAEASRYAVLLFIPGALVLALGIAGLYRRRVGRITGALAVVLGLASIAQWFVLRFGIDYGLEEAELKRTQVALEIGAHALFAGGLAAVALGIAILLRPDLRPVFRPHVPPPPR